ncbi:MAG TPA: N-acetylglucosamine-6-phosphate deacetylase [Edaphobacter sp.]|nr:N-acetylglucosamine-6-phosphate deacetylase [Edaphobacter sp.]
MPTTLTARYLHTSEGTLDRPVITIGEDGLITGIHSDPSSRAEGALTPAFFDIHTHGAANHDVMHATPAELGVVNRFLATRGVGQYLPTTVTAPIDQTLKSLETLADAIERHTARNEARPVGIHLEGPFISHSKRGVHPPADILAPDIALFDRFYQAARGQIRLITIAPETPGALALIEHATALGVKISLGHSNATTDEALAGIEAGGASATHTFNAMRTLDHRDPGILGVVLDDDRLFAELICDGVHVAPAMVRLWLKAKGPHKAILVTDSMSATGMPDGTYMLGTFKVQVADGRCLAYNDVEGSKPSLAGSVLTLDRAVANLQRFTGATLSTAVRLATHNPAKMLGLQDSIANPVVGQPANFNLFSPTGELQSTFLYGERVKAS